MKIDRELLASALFVCRRRISDGQERVVPVATGFVVEMPTSVNDRCRFVITARHVIEEDPVGGLILRCNAKDGTYRDIDTSIADGWTCFDEADIAGYPITEKSALNDPDLDIASVSAMSFLGPGPGYGYEVPGKSAENSFRVSRSVEVGDEVAIIGLFTQDYGDNSILPITRFGRISRMPSVVNTPRWRNDTHRSKAYLIECLSWGGVSGSPVFYPAYYSVRHEPSGSEIALKEYRPMLLGLINGHMNRSQLAQTQGDVLGKITMELNTGIAVVTPSEQVFEFLTKTEISRVMFGESERHDIDGGFYVDKTRDRTIETAILGIVRQQLRGKTLMAGLRSVWRSYATCWALVFTRDCYDDFPALVSPERSGRVAFIAAERGMALDGNGKTVTAPYLLDVRRDASLWVTNIIHIARGPSGQTKTYAIDFAIIVGRDLVTSLQSIDDTLATYFPWFQNDSGEHDTTI